MFMGRRNDILIRAIPVKSERNPLLDSSFSWLDHSESERRKIQEIIDLFRPEGSRDELGIGTVRDAFSDLLFPGTGTVQTRARYLLFVPWMYRNLEKPGLTVAVIEKRARKAEVALIDVLDASEDSEGTIGKRARAGLQRLPSSVYWSGMCRLGIHTFRQSQDRYHRSVCRSGTDRSASRRNDDGDPTEDSGSLNWYPSIPDPPKDFPDGVSFRLRFCEAGFLRDRIRTNAKGSLLDFLVQNGSLDDADCKFPWDHDRVGGLPDTLRQQLLQARNFSEVIRGAALLYNLMLSRQVEDSELIDKYETLIADWRNLMTQREVVFAGWSRTAFWETVASGGARIVNLTQRFIDDWVDIALVNGSTQNIADHLAAQQLITAREKRIKPTKARLTNAEARNDWNESAGIAPLDFRWNAASTIITDILRGLEEPSDA